ncbi:MAG: alpha/beta fold hydrolase [Puniceicoccaceae bacterium]
MKSAADTAPDFLALHGFAGSGADFAVLAGHLGGRWHCPDLPGHGRRAGAGAEDFALRNLAPAVFPGARAALVGVGYSMGARILLHLALGEPGRFSRLVLIGGSPGIAGPGARQARVEADSRWISLLENEGIAAFLDEWQRQPLLRTARPRDPAGIRAFLDRRRRNDPAGLARSLKFHGAGVLPPLWDRLPELRLPVLLCVGANDEKFLRIAESMGGLLPDSTMAAIAGCGHAPHWEAPLETANAISGSGVLD